MDSEYDVETNNRVEHVGWISPDGEFLGFSIPFWVPARAAKVIFKEGAWQEDSPWRLE